MLCCAVLCGAVLCCAVRCGAVLCGAVLAVADRNAEARAEITGWVREGKLKTWETVYDGFEAAPGAFVDLLAGVTSGTTIVRW
jgi:NADPH-dependent curcumin reductase CurA